MSPPDRTTGHQRAPSAATDRGTTTELSPEFNPQEQQALLAQLPLITYRMGAGAPNDIDLVDGAFEHILGYKPVKWLDDPQAWKRAIHEEDRPRCIRKLSLALSSGTVQEWQHRFIHRNGSTVWVKHRIQPVAESPGRPFTSIVGSIEDVTAERLTASKSLGNKQVPPNQAQGLARLAGGIAHEFNNALTAVLGNAQLLLREYAEDHPSRKGILEIISSGERAAELTQELLSFSRTNKFPPALLDLNDLLKCMTPLIQEELTEEQTLVMDLSPTPIFIDGHREMLEKMIIRLVENSRDAMPRDGVLSMRTHCELPSNLDNAPDRFPKDQPLACLSISDTGSGIPEQDRPYIFDPFYSTRDDPKYRGLGLSLALHTIEQHQGFIETNSSSTLGTVMHIYLPSHEKKQDFASPQASEIPTGNETLLLVEDDPSVRVTTERILKSLEYTVLSAKDAQQALEIMGQPEAHVDLALLDIFMPDVDGFTLGRKLQESHPELRCLFISGYAQEALPEEELSANTNFISKPYSREKLAISLRQVLNGEA